MFLISHMYRKKSANILNQFFFLLFYTIVVYFTPDSLMLITFNLLSIYILIFLIHTLIKTSPPFLELTTGCLCGLFLSG